MNEKERPVVEIFRGMCDVIHYLASAHYRWLTVFAFGIYGLSSTYAVALQYMWMAGNATASSPAQYEFVTTVADSLFIFWIFIGAIAISAPICRMLGVWESD